MTQNSPVIDLQAIVGSESAYSPSGNGVFVVDGLPPQAIVEPNTYEQVADVLRYANDNKLAVIPWGGGQHMHVANIPNRYDIALRLTRLDQIIEHEPADLTVSCQAGITMMKLQNELNKSGQMTPFGLSSGLHETLGGNLAADVAVYRQALGGPRDFTIGLRVAMADGRITRTGGKVVKNVAGYDLSKLHIGSIGTLGVIVEASLRLIPQPHEWFGLCFELGSAGQACELAADVHSRGLSVALQSIYNRPPPEAKFVWLVYLGGTMSGVQRSRVEITEVATRSGAVPTHFDPHDTGFERDTSRMLECRVMMLPSKVPEFIREIVARLPSSHLSAEPTAGSAWVRGWSDNQLAVLGEVREIVLRLAGTLTITHCDPELKRQIDVFGEIPPKTLDLMRRIKHKFDPNGILSPGRFVGKL
jgi:glycolate oxidase FAD binding subunit